MTDNRSPAEIAERLSRRRGRILMAQGVIFLFWQVTYYAWDQTPEQLPCGRCGGRTACVRQAAS